MRTVKEPDCNQVTGFPPSISAHSAYKSKFFTSNLEIPEIFHTTKTIVPIPRKSNCLVKQWHWLVTPDRGTVIMNHYLAFTPFPPSKKALAAFQKHLFDSKPTRRTLEVGDFSYSALPTCLSSVWRRRFFSASFPGLSLWPLIRGCFGGRVLAQGWIWKFSHLSWSTTPSRGQRASHSSSRSSYSCCSTKRSEGGGGRSYRSLKSSYSARQKLGPTRSKSEIVSQAPPTVSK